MKKQGIYILTNNTNGKQYVGRDLNLPTRITQHINGKSPQCPHIHNAIKKHGPDAFDIEIIEYPGASHEALNAIEKWHITRLNTYHNGYNGTKGGDGFDSETARKLNQRRINPFAGGEIQRQRVADGTHHLLGGAIQRKSNKERVTNGTHNWQGDGEYQRSLQLQRIADGTHPFKNNPEVQRKGQRYGAYKQRQNGKARRRYRYRLFASLLFTKSLCQIYRTRQLTRDGFFDRDIPNTSQAEQQLLF